MAYRVKCMVCRNVADGTTINEALFNIIHSDGCDYHKLGARVLFDSIDLTKAVDF